MGALRGSELDRPLDMATDARVVSLRDLESWVGRDEATLVEVASPFTLSVLRGMGLNDILRDQPETGFNQLDSLRAEVEQTMHQALEMGADGLVYHLDGPRASACTPMQYGGHYLELDRELLAMVKEARIVLVWVPGQEPLYLDAISDLDAHAVGWNSMASGFPVHEFKALRPGPTFGPDPGHDFQFTPRTIQIEVAR